MGVENSNNDAGVATKHGSYILSTTLSKGFSILECIAQNQPIAPPAIQKVVDLSKGNVHRLLATLEYLGYIVKMKDGYYLTRKMYIMGKTVQNERDLSSVALHFMEELSAKVRHNCYLAVPNVDRMISHEMVKYAQDIQIANDFAVSYPLYCSASGKLYLALLESESRGRLLAEIDLVQRTDNTIIELESLEKELEKIKAQGYSTEIMEYSPNINSIAAPVLDGHGNMVASLAIAAPSMNMPESDLSEVLPLLLEYSKNISENLNAL